MEKQAEDMEGDDEGADSAFNLHISQILTLGLGEKKYIMRLILVRPVRRSHLGPSSLDSRYRLQKCSGGHPQTGQQKRALMRNR